jgi:hypothetical protein
MRMSRKTWLVLAAAALLMISFAASVSAAKRAGDDRSRYVTRGLDYLHARQSDGGGFGTAENTAMAVLGAVAGGERMGDSAWLVKGKNPFDYLQATDLVSASTTSEVTNPPVYYSRLIMAYVAMGRSSSIGTAGSKGVDLLTTLLSYQDTGDASPSKGAFAPALPSLSSAVSTTAWAILAMHNAGVSRTDPRYLLAESWLAAQQNDGSGGDGGFPSRERGGASDALDTAMASQALAVSSDGTDWSPGAARSFLLSAQRANGGFSSTATGSMDAEATSAGVQAILAMGEQPADAAWTTTTGGTPLSALQGLLQTNGSYRLSATTVARPVIVTGWVLVALNEKPFGSGDDSKVFPKNPGPAHKPFKFRPQFRSISPKDGARFTHTRIVLIRATYTDLSPQGTGIDPKACRLSVDGADQTRNAAIGAYGLHLTLKNVANGDHTYTIELRDHAGNLKIMRRKFVVDVATPTSYPTAQPTYEPTSAPTPYPPYTPTPYPSTPTSASATPTPSPLSPAPSASAAPVVIGSPIPSPSVSASPVGAAGSGDGGSAAGFVGGTLLAMLPIGAVISYLLLQRRQELLGAASQGQTLTGGGSAWQRLIHALAQSKDLTRPSSRD